MEAVGSSSKHAQRIAMLVSLVVRFGELMGYN